MESVEPIPLVHELNRHIGTFEILHLLGRKDSATKYAMMRSLHPSEKGIDSAVRYLERLGLIERETNGSIPRRYRLTYRGRALVDRRFGAWPLSILP